MRLLVTGAGGQLGRELGDLAAASGHTVAALDRSGCDITDEASVRRALDEHTPDAVVNCAAWTRVDAAESDPDGAFLVNAIGPRLLAGVCARRDILLTHVSTDYVFGGDADHPLDEWTPTSPRSVYGWSKLAGEDEVRDLAPRHQVVRTSWLYGRDGPNFVLTMLRAADAGRALRVVDDQVGCPTWTGHLAPTLLDLVGRGTAGTFHLSNSGSTSWHGFAEEIFRATRREVAVEPIPTSAYPTPAPRPRYSVLDNRAWRLLGGTPLPDWREGVAAYVATLPGGGAVIG